MATLAILLVQLRLLKTHKFIPMLVVLEVELMLVAYKADRQPHIMLVGGMEEVIVVIIQTDT